MRRTLCYMLCLLVMAVVISGCSTSVKQASAKDIVANYQKDTASVVKNFSAVVFAQGSSKDIGKELNDDIEAYKSKYYKNPNLTEKEDTITNAFVDAVTKYNKSRERKDDKFNVEDSIGNYADVVTVLGDLHKLGFEVNTGMK